MPFVAIVIAVVAIVGSLVVRNFFPVEHLSHGQQTRTFTIDMDFDRFRQILVRKNGTESIINYSGMKLLNQRLEDIAIDVSQDKRPVINAILGKSKAIVAAAKTLTVEMNDPSLGASTMHLRQVAEIEPSKIDIVTSSTEPAGKLEKYTSTLHAEPMGQFTQVTIGVDMTVRVIVPKLFTRRADSRVQDAADKAVVNQADSMGKFFAEHANKTLILPELGVR